MATKYRLTCTCRESFWVGKSQAGEDFVCKCGATVEVPTIRGLAELEQKVEPDPAPGWSRTQGSLFVLGAAVLLTGAAVTWWLAGRIPAHTANDTGSNRIPAAWNADSIRLARLYRARPEVVAAVAQRLNPEASELDAADSLRLWSLYRDLGPVMFRLTTDAQQLESQRHFYRLWSWVVGTVTVLLAAGLIGTALLRKS